MDEIVKFSFEKEITKFCVLDEKQTKVANRCP